MRTLHVACAAAVLLLVAGVVAPIASLGAEQKETERVTRSVPLSPGGTLKLKSFSGRVTITGADQSEVSIDAVRRATRERLDHVRLDIAATGSVVTIDANKRDESWFTRHRDDNNVVETDFEIRVPSRTSLDIAVFSSPVTVTNVSGRHAVHTFSSELRLIDVAGPLRAHTFSGDVRVQLARSEDRPELDVDTFSGDIEVRMPETARAGVSFNSFSGDLKSDLPLTVKSSGRRSLRAVLNGGDGQAIRLKTFSGDVRLTR